MEEAEIFVDCDDGFNDAELPCLNAERFYAVSLPSESGGRRHGYVLTSQKEAQHHLKSVAGSRFKVFKNYQAARHYADTPAELFTSPIQSTSPRVREDTDLYNSVSQRDINQFKAAILRGDAKTVSVMLWNNPKYMVNNIDVPTHLHPHFRYNALHEACSRGHDTVVRLLLQILSGLEIWRRINKEMSSEAISRRCHRYMDMLLNGRETGRGETPLHFAFKFGHVSCARALLTHPQSDAMLRNFDGHTAEDIVATRMTLSNTRSVASELRGLLRERYVALLQRSQDGVSGADSSLPYVAKPMHWCELQALLQNSLVLAYTGPLLLERANDLYHQWSQPCRPLQRIGDASHRTHKLVYARLVDPSKGYECLGRQLAADFGSAWRERWDFLGPGVFADLSHRDGLRKLEEHLEQRGRHHERNGIWRSLEISGIDKSEFTDSSLMNDTSIHAFENKEDSLTASFLDQFANLRLGSLPCTPTSTKCTRCVTSVSQLDRHVLTALQSAEHVERYPRLYNWMLETRRASLSSPHLSVGLKLQSPKCYSTPEFQLPICSGTRRLQSPNCSSTRGLQSPNYSGARGLQSPNYSGARGLQSPNYSGTRGLQSPNYSGARGLQSPNYSGTSGLQSLKHCGTPCGTRSILDEDLIHVRKQLFGESPPSRDEDEDEEYFST